MRKQSKYSLTTTIVILDNYYIIYDITSGYSEKQARFEFYQRIMTYFKIDKVVLTEKVVCKLIKENIAIPILDLAFKNFKVYVK